MTDIEVPNAEDSRASPQACRSITQQDLGFHLKKLTRAISQRYDEILRPTDLRSGQVALLAVTREEGSATIFHLAEIIGVDRTVLSRNIKPLIKKGLIQVKPGPDRRTRWVSLTPAGIDTLDKALPVWERAMVDTRTLLGESLTRDLLESAKAGYTRLTL